VKLQRNFARSHSNMSGADDRRGRSRAPAYGQSDGKALATKIPIERSSDDEAWICQQQSNCEVPGISRQATEHKHPDGSTVSSYHGLQGSVSLYVEIAGETLEASNACELFMAQLSNLIDALEAASVRSHGALQQL
jgi:hypothetical protein